MKGNWKMGMALVALMVMGCSSHPETLDSSDTVTVSRNEAVVSQEASTTESTAETTKQAEETTTSQEQNALAKEAIKEIETVKNVLLDDHYSILVQNQTDTTIDINIRHKQGNTLTNYGFFRYHQDTKVLEEMDSSTGNYQTINS